MRAFVEVGFGVNGELRLGLSVAVLTMGRGGFGAAREVHFSFHVVPALWLTY